VSVDSSTYLGPYFRCKTGAPRLGAADDRCGVEIALDDVGIIDEKRWLEDAFTSELATLMGFYGDDNVETRWGLIRWCS
jgi:hypothetical protein